METQEVKINENTVPEASGRPESKDESNKVIKGLLGFFLTIVGIPAVMFGTCFLNMRIYDHLGEDYIFHLYIAWFGFPVLLFGFIAWLTKNIWVIWGLLCFILVVVIYLLAQQ